ncbi:hypothetical protein [Cesiribacter andamanensis]|uniref:LemA family protein n=1 Tax=Cesiribacter andamanensis AMV16 TaxID=1279009 RepID=M7NS89_9BACT|nr:hypothetical protein [Cesiribacter andamanensis]EMR04565.1 hypothetical protein ADICEAN_00323 [Cesiribacter andamanensis AMV16]
MRKAIRIFVFVLLMAAAYTACQRASEEKREDAPDSVLVIYNTLNDSVRVAWDRIVTNEEQKLSDMRRLLQEISYTPSYNQVRYDSLWAHLQQINRFRFEAETMTSRQIDQYDSAVTRLQREIVDFARTHPNFDEYALMSKLTDSISAADQRVLFLRTDYDDYARNYNDFLKGSQGTRLQSLQATDTTGTPKIRPLFSLGE